MEIRRIGVVGCGQMGSGIAQIAIESGYETVIFDRASGALIRTKDQIVRGLIDALKSRDCAAEDESNLLSKLHLADSLEAFAECDIVIESIIEDLHAKKDLFAQLEEICPAETLLVSNTSAFSITQMGSELIRKDRFAGFHFHLPVTRMQVIDVIPTEFTSDDAIHTLIELGESLGKEIVVVKDTPGFIVNRLLVPFIIDAIVMLENGVADRDDIDKSMQLAANHPMGPLMLADFIGLDTVERVSRTLHAALGEARLDPPQMLKEMVSAGDLGLKSGRGFYNYNEPTNEGDRQAKLFFEIMKILD